MTPTTESMLRKFGDDLRSKDRQAATVESYCRDAAEFMRYIEGFGLNPERVEGTTLLSFRDHLLFEEKDRENSVRRKIIGIRQFFRFLASEHLIDHSPFDDMPIPERDDRLKEMLQPGQIEALLRGINPGNLKQSRDKAIVHLLAFEGIKAHELIDLQWIDFADTSVPTLNIPGTKNRTITLAPETHEHLRAYARHFEEWSSRMPPEKRQRFRWIFVSFKGKDGSLVHARMTRHGLKFLLYELGEKFHLPHLNTEVLRHYAIEHQLTEGWSPEKIMQHLGLRRLGNIGKHLAQRKLEL
jgi:integrase/recombinase XerD